MQFSKRLPYCALTILLSGCSTLEQVVDVFGDEAPSASPPAAESAAEAASTASVPSTVPENPSLAIQAQVSEEARQRYQAAVALLADNKLADARAAFTRLHNAYPQYSGPLLNLGIIAEAEQDEEAALDFYAAAIKASPYNQQAYNRQAVLLRKRGDFKAAERSYLDAIAQWPGYAPVRLNLGILYELYMGRLADAAEQYQAYQGLLETPDPKVKAWLADLSRRVQTQSEGQ